MKKKMLFLALVFFGFSTIGNGAEEDEEEDGTELALSDEKLIAAAAPDRAGSAAAGHTASQGSTGNKGDFIDPRVLRDFVESKGLISCRQKEGLLTIAGDVRARWISAAERIDGVSHRGPGTNMAINRFKSEINLYLDYAAPRSWSTTKLKFSSFDGIDSGTPTRVEMERAFIGYDIYNQKEEDFYIEIGRSNLDYMFESRVEFGSIFDGIHLYYTMCWPSVGQFTIHGGPFIVDAFTNHYAWVIETFVTKWRGTGISFKYSLVDWHHAGLTYNYGNVKDAGELAVHDHPRYRFIVSQMLFGYEREIDFVKCKTLFLYGAVLVNHDAKASPQTRWQRLNNAWYIGFTLGKLCKACDWSVDINYQSVQAQAVPEFDSNGIGHGNVAIGLLSDAILAGLPPPPPPSHDQL